MMEKKISKLGLWLVVTGLILVVSKGVCENVENYDTFNRYELKLSTPNNRYSIGDKIELIFEVRSSTPGKIRIFEEKYKSLFLFIYQIKKYGPELTYEVKNDKNITGREKIETILIDRNKPYSLKINGNILKNSTSDNIIFDFFEFGKFEVVEKKDKYTIGGFWRPINPHPVDSFEDSTNMIEIFVEGNTPAPK